MFVRPLYCLCFLKLSSSSVILSRHRHFTAPVEDSSPFAHESFPHSVNRRIDRFLIVVDDLITTRTIPARMLFFLIKIERNHPRGSVRLPTARGRRARTELFLHDSPPAEEYGSINIEDPESRTRQAAGVELSSSRCPNKFCDELSRRNS